MNDYCLSYVEIYLFLSFFVQYSFNDFSLHHQADDGIHGTELWILDDPNAASTFLHLTSENLAHVKHNQYQNISHVHSLLSI